MAYWIGELSSRPLLRNWKMMKMINGFVVGELGMTMVEVKTKKLRINTLYFSRLLHLEDSRRLPGATGDARIW